VITAAFDVVENLSLPTARQIYFNIGTLEALKMQEQKMQDLKIRDQMS